MTAPLLLGLCLLGTACGPEPAAPAEDSPQASGGAPVASEAPEAAAERGAITCAEPVHDFGQVWEGARLFHEFVLEVEGEQRISAAKGTCGCTLTQLQRLEPDGSRRVYHNDDPLSDGDRVAVGVTYHTRGKAGAEDRGIKVFTNQGRMDLTIQADVRPYLTCSPQKQLLGRISVADRRKVAFEVRSVEGQPFLLEHRPTEPLPAGLSVQVEPLGTADERGRAPVWTALVDAGPGLEKGILELHLPLVTDVPHPDAPPAADGGAAYFEVVPNVVAQVVGLVELSRTSLTFPFMEADEVVARTVTVSCMDLDHQLGEPYAVLEPLQPLPAGTAFPLARTARLTVRRTPKQANAWDVEVLLDGLAEDVPSPFGARLLIHTDHPSEGTLVGSVRGSRKSGSSAR